MLELALKDRLKQTGEDRFELEGKEPTGDDVIDDAINIMKDVGPTPMDEWMKSLIGTIITRKGIPRLEERIYERLVAKKVLKKEKTLLGGEKFPFYDNPEIDRLIQQVKNSLSTPPNRIEELHPRDFCLVGLFHALDKPFANRPGNALDINRIYPDKDERRKMRENVELLLNENALEGSFTGETSAVSESVRHSILRRMIRLTFLGMFNVVNML